LNVLRIGHLPDEIGRAHEAGESPTLIKGIARYRKRVISM
jgi:hypothetical protein